MIFYLIIYNLSIYFVSKIHVVLSVPTGSGVYTVYSETFAAPKTSQMFVTDIRYGIQWIFFDSASEGITMTQQTVTVTSMTGFFYGRINGK